MADKMTSRQRVEAAVNFRKPDRIPIDLGGCRASGINSSVYTKLKRRLGINTPTKVQDTMQILAEIEPEVLEELRAFVPGTPNKAKRQSSGWGLCLAQRYVAAHGGSLEIESKVDVGTAVTMTLSMRTQMEADDE